MSELVSLEALLKDSLALTERASRAGLSVDQAKAFLNELAELPISQVARLILIAHRERNRAAQTAERKKDRR